MALQIGHTEVIPPVNVDATLPELATECRAILKARQGLGVALAVRLAVAKKIIVAGQSTERNFSEWCRKNILKPDGQPYSIRAVNHWVVIGNKPDPAIALERARAAKRRRNVEQYRSFIAPAKATFLAIMESAKTGKVMNRPRKTLPSDVSQEVNSLMSAWENASEAGRTQFLYMIGAALQGRRSAR